MRLRFPGGHQNDGGERTPKRDKASSIRHGQAGQSSLSKPASLASFSTALLPPIPATPAPVQAPSSPMSSTSSSFDHYPVTPAQSPAVSPLVYQTPSRSSPRPSSRLTFYEPSMDRQASLLSSKDDHSSVPGASGDSRRNVVTSFSKRMATLVRNHSWSMQRVDEGSQETTRPQPSPGRRGVVKRGHSTFRALRADEVKYSLWPEEEACNPRRVPKSEPSYPAELSRRPKVRDDDAATTRTYVSTPFKAKAPPSSIKSEAFRPSIPPAEPHIKRCQSQYMNHSNDSHIWTEAMRLQVEYYTRPPSPPDSLRRGPAPPPRPQRRRGAESVKSLPLQSAKERLAAPSIKTISATATHAEAATAALAEMVASKHARPAVREVAPASRLPRPVAPASAKSRAAMSVPDVPRSVAPAPDMPQSARSSCSLEERPGLPTPAALAAAEARLKVKRKTATRNSMHLPGKPQAQARASPTAENSPLPSQTGKSSPSSESFSSLVTRSSRSGAKQHVRRGTFGENDMVDIAGAREELIGRLHEDSSSESCEPRSSHDSVHSVQSSLRSGSVLSTHASVDGANGRQKPWGYL